MIETLSDNELETYARQIVLQDIGYDGQLRLRNAKVAIVGIGGLGSPTALKLTGMGVGTLRLIDRDIVSRSDLHRQILYDAAAVGRPKVEVAVEKLQRLNPDLVLEPVPESINSLNAVELLGGMDVIVDGLDRPEPRYLVNRTCRRLNIPYVFGAAIESFGNAATIVPGQTFCLECFMPGLRDEDLPTCGLVGVHPSILGIISAVQVSETVRLLTGKPPHLLNKLFYADLRQFDFQVLDYSAQESCPVCGSSPVGKPQEVTERFFEETCSRDGRRNFVLTPRRRITVDLDRLQHLLPDSGYPLKTAGRLGISFAMSPEVDSCILQSGIMIAQALPVAGREFGQDILSAYRLLLVDGLGQPEEIVPHLDGEDRT